MKLTINQQVAIYASALEGVLSQGEANDPAAVIPSALEYGDKLIAALEARNDDNEADPHEPVTD